MKVNSCLANFTFDIYCGVKFGIATIWPKTDRHRKVPVTTSDAQMLLKLQQDPFKIIGESQVFTNNLR